MEKHTLFKMLMIALCITFSISTVYGSSLQKENLQQKKNLR